MPADGEIRFLTTNEALAIHDRIIERFGGVRGIRDLGLLESALFRPRTGYYADLVGMAAGLFESFLVNHAVIDGNKRMAFFATDVFLRLNGHRLAVEAESAHRFILELLETRGTIFERVAGWIREQVRAR